jgi:hypothetical protein
MFVIVNNNFVIWGPKNWNKLSFEDVLRSDLEIEYTLETRNDSGNAVVIDANTSILKVVPLPWSEFNQKTERLNGPYWNFYEDRAEMYFEVEPKPIEFVKQELKAKIADKRWQVENAGFTANVQNTTVTIDTSRDGRQMFFNTYMAMGDVETITWKFPETWLTINKLELGGIVLGGKAHIQAAFDWESSKADEIDSATTLEELDAIDVDTVV